MYKNKLLFLVLSLLVLTQVAIGQNNTNSPYTRFGYGDIVDNNSAEQRGMGGIGIGTRSNQSINAMNPASYSAVDSMTFMFDLGTSVLASHFSDKTIRKTTLNSNLEYITMQFPLAKWLGFSAGMLPYSFSGYNFFQNDTTYITNSSTRDNIPYTRSFVGTGGFSQVYTGISANFFKHISVGVNAYYMFGNMANNRYLTFSNTADYTSTAQYNSITASSFRFRYGAQFYNTFDKKHDVTLGFIYEQKAKFNGSFSKTTSGVLTDTISTAYEFEMPTVYGIGLYYTYNKKLSIAIDYTMQQWKDAKFYWSPDSLKNLENLTNRSKLAIGMEYIPNPTGRKFADKVKYRLGFNISDSYFKVDGVTPPKNFGVSVGVGLPLYNKASGTVTMLNTSLEYGKIGSQIKLQEDYLKLTLNVAFNEHWFFKRKL